MDEKVGEISNCPPSQNSENIRVLIISLHADPAQPSGAGEGGGTHAYVRELLRDSALNQRQCTVVTRHADPNLSAHQTLSDFTQIYRIKIGDIAPLDKKALNSLHDTTMSQILRVWEKLPNTPTVVHGVYWNSGRVAMDLSRMFSIPHLQTVISNGHRRYRTGYHDDEKNRIEMEQNVYTNANLIFCICEQEKEDLINFYHIKPEKIVVVGRPVPRVFSAPSHSVDGTPRTEIVELSGNNNAS